MNFQDAELQYRNLEKKWAAGQLSPQAYRDSLAKIRVVDESGNIWMLQDHTGCWFVYRDGRWLGNLRPPVRVVAVNQPPTPPARQAAPRPQPAPVAPKTAKRKSGMFLVFALLGVCLCCGLPGVAGGLGVISGWISLPPQLADWIPQFSKDTQAPLNSVSEVDVKTNESVPVPADGAPHADSNGVSLAVPAEALEEGGQVTLAASDLNAPWSKALESAVTLETPFYSLTAQGKNDTTGSLTLSFPAANPQARLLAVIDNEYLVELAQTPQDGKLTLQTRAGPADTAEWTPPEGYDGTGSIYYAVITPRAASRQPSDIQMVSLRHQADERNCIPDLSIIGGAAINLCRQNPSGTVQVMLPTTQRDLLPQVDVMVDKIEAVMKKYYDLGFTTAQLSHSSPMLVRVSTKVTSPSYYPLNGVLYIPADSVAKIASLSPTDVYHEMAHWIQAVKYSTRLAYWSGEKTWWLETSAENMVMLVEPAYVGSNLTTYGTISAADNSLALQAEPYQWPGDFYVQAQLVKVNICDSAACPLSQASFAKAISEGVYPLMDGGKKSMVSGNLKDYAYYLLGKSPVRANSAIPLNGPVSTGEGFGEYVRVTRTADTDIKYDYNGSDPQMRKETVDGKDALAIQAAIHRDGVYPLMVQGGQGKNPGLPVELVIEPGAPFYYTLDDGEFQYSDGSQELKILPIHGEMGIKKVRLVAVGENGGEVFKARVQPLDLQGAWTVIPSSTKTAGAMTCSGGSGETENPDGTGQLMAFVIALMGGTGDMQADPTGRSLDWVEVASRVPAEIKEDNFTFDATALLAGNEIKYQAQVDIPQKSDQSSLPPLIPAASAVIILPAFWLGRKRLNTRHARIAVNMLVISTLILVSSGCFGMGMYGSATLDAKFSKIEYVGGQDTGVLTFFEDASETIQGEPLWKLTGTGTYDVTFFIETTVTDFDGNDTTEVTTCTGQVTYPVTGYVYKDFSVQLPQE